MRRIWTVAGGALAGGIVVLLAGVFAFGPSGPRAGGGNASTSGPEDVDREASGEGADAGGEHTPSAAPAPRPDVASAEPAAIPSVDRTRDPGEDRLRPVDEDLSEALGPVAAEHEAFLELDVVVDVEGLPREEQDARLKEALREKRAALERLEAAYQALLEQDPPPRVRSAALIRLGDAYDHLGVSLEQSTLPSYLNEEQTQVYRMGMSRMAAVWYDKADATWDGAEAE